MKDWPKQATKWVRKALPEVIDEPGASAAGVFQRLAERWAAEMAGEPKPAAAKKKSSRSKPSED